MPAFPRPLRPVSGHLLAARAVLVLLALVLAACPGCAGPTAAATAAERATYRAIAPEYADFVIHAQTLDAAAKARRLRTLHAWHARLSETDADLPPPPALPAEDPAPANAPGSPSGAAPGVIEQPPAHGHP